MKIVLGFPMQDKQTGVYVKEAFEELGHNVVAVNDPRVHSGSPGEIIPMIKAHSPDFVFLAKDPRYNDVVEEIAANAFTVMWNVDVRYDPKIFLDTCGPLYDHCHLKFTIGEGNLKKYAFYGVKNIYWLSEGIAPNWHFWPEEIVMKDSMQYACEVAFAGTRTAIHDGREEVINALEKSEFDFQEFHGVFNIEHNKLCRLANINLGQSGWPKVSLSMSARDYRVMGAGGFLLTNHVEGIDEWFQVGLMCDTYKTPEECLEKVAFYLKHADLRKRMALDGMKVVHEKHKFSDRMREVIAKVEEMK